MPSPSPRRISSFELAATVGFTVGERYEVEAVLGHGTFGRVLRARDVVTGETVALKEFVRQPGRADSFLRELGILFELKHPAVIDCQSLVMSGAVRYLVCEFMECGSMRALLDDPRTPVPLLLRLLEEAASGVAYAHRRNVIHRDLKPDNILLSRRSGEAHAKVSDFGISTLGTEAGLRSAIGSPAYMAPEQFYDQYDARIDIYALGVIAYEILCGRRPFTGSPAQLMTCRIRQEPEMPDWLPRSFARVLRKALAKKPERRFATVESFSAALRIALHADGEALLRTGFPLQTGKVQDLLQAGDELYVQRADEILRLDACGRVIARLPAADAMISAGPHVAFRRGDALSLRGPARSRQLDVPASASVALSSDGLLAVHVDGGVFVVDGVSQHRLTPRGAGVTSVAFVGRDQTACLARTTDAGSTLEYGGVVVPLPEPIGALDGHPERYEIVARAAADPSRIYLVRLGQATRARLACGRLTCDGENFYAATEDGALAAVNVSSSRVARTRWDWELSSVAASAQRIVCVTTAGQMICLQ